MFSSLSGTTNQSRFCLFGIKFFIFSIKQERSLDNKILDNAQMPFQANYQHYGEAPRVFKNSQSQTWGRVDYGLPLYRIFKAINAQILQTLPVVKVKNKPEHSNPMLAHRDLID